MKLALFLLSSVTLFLSLTPPGPASAESFREAIDRHAKAIEARMIAWRRDIHQHPELGNREFRTAALVAEHLRKLGYEVREKVAHTGVVAVLKGGKPGPVVALRADMDALPVTEEVDLPFASKARATWRGQRDRRHACLRPRCACRHPDGGGRGASPSCAASCPAR